MHFSLHGHDMVLALLLAIAVAFCLSLVIVQGMTGVPPLSSSKGEAADVVALLKQGGVRDRAVIYELGSGWGSLAIALAQAFPTAQIRGIEMSPLPLAVSRFRARNLANVVLRQGNFYKADLSGADAVTCYLMSKPMPILAAFLDRQLQPGTPVVSISFWFRDRAVIASRKNAGMFGAAALYAWPASKPAQP